VEIHLRRKDDCIIADLCGVLDIYNHNDLYTIFNKLIHMGNTKIIINMKNVDYMDSAGIGALVALFKITKKQSIDLIFTHFQETVKRRLVLSKLYSFLPVAATDEDALKELT
jgi:anti-sigma B factor antagonist